MSDKKIIGGVSIMGFIAPNSIYDTYPVIDPLYGIDGLRNVNTIDDLIAIPDERRRAGMIVGVDGGDRYFKLKDIVWGGTISDWDEIKFLLIGDKKSDITFIDKEKPTGLTDGVNTIFKLSHIPIPNSEHLYLNGILQEKGDDLDYILDGKNIIFLEAPFNGMRVICSYRI
jgi:hypothetical protein